MVIKNTAFESIGLGWFRVYNINRPSQYLILRRDMAAVMLRWIRLGSSVEIGHSSDPPNYELTNG